MRKFSRISVVLLIALIMCLAASCTSSTNQTEVPETPKTSTTPSTTGNQTLDPLWENATYTENKELGEGEKTITVLVKAGEKTITFTVKTDAATLGDALTEHGIIEGSMGDYGLMVEKVNGIQAIYSKDNAYWALYSHGEYAMSGADQTNISDGDQYEWVYTKA